MTYVIPAALAALLIIKIAIRKSKEKPKEEPVIRVDVPVELQLELCKRYDNCDAKSKASRYEFCDFVNKNILTGHKEVSWAVKFDSQVPYIEITKKQK